MKAYGDTLIIGVDAGYGNMKTASCIFPTGIAAYDEKPFFTENLLIYNDRFYIIGSGHKEYTDRKIVDEDYYVLTLAAIARVTVPLVLNANSLILPHTPIKSSAPVRFASRD